MTHYRQQIARTTGITDPQALAAIEYEMRSGLSGLDHLDRTESYKMTRDTVTTSAPSIRQATEFLVVIVVGDDIGGQTHYEAEYHPTLDRALDAYNEYASGEWDSHGINYRPRAIHACRFGNPFAQLSAASMMQLMHELRTA